MDGILYLKPTAGCQITTLIFGLEGDLYIFHEQLQMNVKVLAHLGHKSKVLPDTINDLSIWVGICTSSPQQGVKYQLLYLDFCLGGGLYKFSIKNCQPTAKFVPTWIT
jgi:hypothetical protein